MRSDMLAAGSSCGEPVRSWSRGKMLCIRRWHGQSGCRWGLRRSYYWRERSRCAACRSRWRRSCMSPCCGNWTKKGSGLVDLYIERVEDLIIDIPEINPVFSFSQIKRIGACPVGDIGLVGRDQLPGGIFVGNDLVEIIGLGQVDAFYGRLNGKGYPQTFKAQPRGPPVFVFRRGMDDAEVIEVFVGDVDGVAVDQGDRRFGQRKFSQIGLIDDPAIAEITFFRHICLVDG